MLKKILIWDYNLPIRNIGGPSGYLYNIKEYIKDGDKNIYFLSEIIKQKIIVSKKSSFLKRLFNKLFHDIKMIYKWFQTISEPLINQNILNQYDIIHFHSSIDLLNAHKLISNFKGKIILTTHSPQPASLEMIDGFMYGNKITNKLISRKLLRRELKAWNIANYIMFPVKDAIEPYIKYPLFLSYYTQNTNKFIYCESALLNVIPSNSSNQLIRKHLNITENDILITYIGRHNSIKGYDILKHIGNYLLERIPNLYIVVGGQEKPIKGLQHERWIELGWIDYGNQLITESDLFILPNRETYFDLIALEVLRIGTPLLMAQTGGNKYFKQIKNYNSGIMFFDVFNIDLIYIENIINSLKDHKLQNKMRADNNLLFNNLFTMDKYIKRYHKMCSNL